MRADFIGWMERAERGLHWTVGLALVVGAAVAVFRLRGRPPRSEA